MNKTLILLLFFIACPIVVMAQPLLVELVNQNEPLDPGKVHTLVFKIYHQNNHPVTLTPHVLLPENWPMTSSLTDIQLSGNEEKIYLMQIHVPSNASTGKHELRLVLQNQEKKRTEYEFEILVNQLRKISVNSVSSTAYVKAGETIHSIFIVKNEGNQSEIFSLESSQNAAIEGETTLSLAAGEVREVHIHQPTNVNYPRPSQQSIKLTAYNVMDSLPGVYAYNRTEVIPVITQNEDVFYRFPAKASVSYLGRERAGEFQDSYQGEIYGKGSLDEHNVHQLEFRAFGPNQFELSTFYQYEEYFANYQTDNFFVHFGDKVFSSSFLTEYARYGRGAEVRKSIRQWEVGGFYNNPRFYKDIEEEINLYTQYNFNKKNHLRYGYLNKQMENQNENYHLHFLTGETTLFKKIQLKGEYTQSFSESTQGYAWYLQASAHLKKVTANVSYIDASPDFGGYYKNTSFFNSHINYRISPQLTLHANFQQDARNFQRDTLYAPAPYRERIQSGLRYNFKKTTTIAVYGGWQEYEDRNTSKFFHYRERFVRFDINQQIKKWGIHWQTYFAETYDFLSDNNGLSSIYSLNLNYINNKSYFNIFGSYSKLSRYQLPNDQVFLYGGSFNSYITDKWNISASYQNSYYLEDYYKDRNLFELNLNYKLSPIQEISLSSRYTLAQQQIGNKDFLFRLKYTVNLNIPIKKIKEYGSLEGMISKQNGTNPEGIKLRLGNQTTLVDANGTFYFRNIPPDVYYLEIVQGSLGFDEITDVKMPMKLTVMEGQNYINFDITNAASLKGEIKIVGDDQSVSGQNIIVEISSEKEVYRKIVDINKSFDFTYLRPGNWQMKIYRNGLSSLYRIKNETLNFELVPGEVKDVVLEIEKQQREVKYLQQPVRVGMNNARK